MSHVHMCMLFLDADTLGSFFFCFIFPRQFLCVLQCEMCKHVRPLRPRRQNTQEVRCCCFVNTLKIYLNEQLEKLGWFSPKGFSLNLWPTNRVVRCL